MERSPLPGGLNRSSLYVGHDPPRAVRGEGFHVWDERGRRLIDLNGNFTTLIHGHAHPAIVSAASQAVREGVCFGLPNSFEESHARALLERFDWADSIRYVNTGTEAIMSAIRLARAHTGRDRLVFVEGAYHGWSDTALLTSEGRRRGVPHGVADDVDTVPLNDVAALEEIVDRNGRNLAAIILDLIPNRAGLLPLSEQFVRTARSLADAWGIVLVFDEVMSLRLAFRGRQQHYGVEPDLTVLGKLIGGGFPVGAVVGRAGVMDLLNPGGLAPLEHGGTFTANPVTMRAGEAALRLLTPEAISRLNRLGEQLRAQLRTVSDEWEVRGVGSFARLVPQGNTAEDEPTRLRELWWAAYNQDVLLMPTGLMSLSTVMDSTAITEVVTRLAVALAEIAHARSP